MTVLYDLLLMLSLYSRLQTMIAKDWKKIMDILASGEEAGILILDKKFPCDRAVLKSGI